jgi:CheY-like chemotaxis protein
VIGRQAAVLVVEDSGADAEMTLHTLRGLGIAQDVEWVSDGVEAVKYLFCEGIYASRGEAQPRLVLLDLKMPRMDGLQVLGRMKADARTRTIPVVMLSSSREQVDVAASYELGANSYVVKPVDADAYAEIVAQVGAYWLMANEIPE